MERWFLTTDSRRWLRHRTLSLNQDIIMMQYNVPVFPCGAQEQIWVSANARSQDLTTTPATGQGYHSLYLGSSMDVLHGFCYIMSFNY